MENETVYKPTIKKFLGYDVRVVTVDKSNEYIICRDIFDVLGLVKDDGTWTDPRNKMLRFLDGIGERPAHQSLVVRLKDKQSKKGQARTVDCLNIEVAPIVLTQFQPTKRRGEEILKRWYEFMKFVDMLLKYHECYKYIIDDKEKQKTCN